MRKYKEEIWVDVVNYEGLYEISTLGRVRETRNNRERLLEANVSSSDWFENSVMLYKNGDWTRFETRPLLEASIEEYEIELFEREQGLID